jgi:hypothetical protein
MHYADVAIWYKWFGKPCGILQIKAIHQVYLYQLHPSQD